MKTPMKEVYENLNLMSDSDFKAWMLNTDLLQKEKQMIINAHKDGNFCFDHFRNVDIVEWFADGYYKDTFYENTL
jgi:hypothetical protein